MDNHDVPVGPLVGAIGAGVLVLVFILGVTLLLGIGPWVTVSEGYVGVQTEKGAATGEIYEPGWSMKVPISQGYEEIETRPRTVTYAGEENIEVITQDGQDVYVDVTVRYSVTEEDAVTFFQVANSHEQAQNRFIEPNVRSDLRDEASDMSVRDVITKEGRLQLEEAAIEALQENFEGTGMTVEAVSVRDVQPNADFSAELEKIEIENARAEQRVIEADGKAEAEVTEAEGNAEAEIIEAEARADAYEIRDEQLTDDVLTEEYIKSIDDGDKVILATDDEGTPIIIDAETEAESEGDGE